MSDEETQRIINELDVDAARSVIAQNEDTFKKVLDNGFTSHGSRATKVRQLAMDFRP